MAKRFVLLSAALIIVACQQGRKEIVTGLIADSAMVVSAHPLASKVGVDIMKKGGNAVDAAIAVHFALTVVYPWAGNIGGGGFMVYRQHDGQSFALDFRERAPAASSHDMYLDADGNVVPTLSTGGHLASGVPGSVDGMIELHQKFGTMKWADLVQPSIDLAFQGVPLTEVEARNLNRVQDSLRKYNSILPDFLIREWSKDDTLKWIDLGRTLERIRDHGRAGFYEGITADHIIAEMERGNGIITREDLRNYKSTWRNPLVGKYKDYTIISMPPPSSGGIALLQLLKSVEPYPIRKWGWNTARTTHLMVEAERRAFADRATYLGDPDFFDVPVSTLISSAYVQERMSTFSEAMATPSSSVPAGIIAGYESLETTHFSIIDAKGNIAAITTTLNGGYGNYVVVAGSGFLLNNEMDDFSAKPGALNMFNVPGGTANKIEPGKRMLSSMTPTIIEKNGKPVMTVGAPGGSTIITTVFQIILNKLEHGMTMQEAVNARRFHSQWIPDRVVYEVSAFDSLTLEQLKLKNHTMAPMPPASFLGRACAIYVRPDGKLEGGADPRGDNASEGY